VTSTAGTPTRTLRVLAVGVFLFQLAPRPALAADTGQFQVLIAAPDPVVAGERVQFQVIAVNQGTEVWRARRLYLEAEVYDAGRQYAAKTERFRATADVAPGESVVANIPFEVPVTYGGRHFYRVFLVHNDQRIIESDYRPFQVRERPIVPPRPPAVALGGNIVASYKNDTGPTPYVGNLSVNMVGRAKDRSFLFNAYTFHDPEDPIDVYTVLFNYYGPVVTAGLGDVSPTFSPLSVYGQGMRGALWESKTGLWGLTLVGARTANSQDGTATTDGVFRRMLYGAKNEFYLPGRLTVRANYVNSMDVEDSVDTAGPTLAPVDDRVAGGGLTWEAVPGLKIEGDYQSSSFEANKLSTAPAVTDSAWRGAIGMDYSKFSFNGYVQRTGTDFVSLGAPNATRDRFTYDAGLSVYPANWMSFYGSFNRYNDNLEDNPALVTTTQQIMNSGVSFNLPTMTGLSLGYSVNTAVGEPRTAQDNETLTTSVGLSQSWKGQSVSVTLQNSEFEDKTNTTSDLKTDTIGSALNLSFGRRASSSLGATLSNTDDQIDGSTQETQSFSASLNAELRKDRLYGQLWGTLTATEDDDLVNRTDRRDTSLNLEFTCQLKPSLALTVGAYRNQTTDAVTPANDVTANGGNTRISYSF
jgi:hypothetical protein